MKTTMKKTVGLLLALIMVLGMLPMTAFAAAPSRLDITGQVPTLDETVLSYKDFTIAQEDVHMGNARWVYSLAGEENYDDPHSANYGESYGNAFQPGRRYKLWLSVFMDNGVSGYFDRSVVVTYNGVPVAAENISLANQGKAVSIAIMFDPLIETVAKPVYKGDITADGVIHQISEFYDFSTLPEGTKVFRQVDEDTWVWLDAHSDLSSLEVRLPVETSFTLILPSGYVFEGEEGSNQMECTVRVLPASDKPCDGGDSCPGKDFTDMPKVSNWAHAGIDFCVKNGLFGGMSKTIFEPEGNMTRAMLVTVLYRLEGKPSVTAENPFADVANSQWYTDAVIWAASSGVVNGVGDGKFAPDANITREQMAAILYRYAQKKGFDTTARADLKTYPDYGEISAYARDSLSWANVNGLIGGTTGADGKTILDPQGNATRAQVAAILMRYVKNIVQK